MDVGRAVVGKLLGKTLYPFQAFELNLVCEFEEKSALLLTRICSFWPTVGRAENRKCWKITKTQVDPIDAHKNKTICMI